MNKSINHEINTFVTYIRIWAYGFLRLWSGGRSGEASEYIVYFIR
jgi:hypothetical protein